MGQQTLLGVRADSPRLETNVWRTGTVLEIPEGPSTIPCTHGLHRFPGKFVPNIPRYLIREILPSETKRVIFDPFCGSGTTLVEAALEGRSFLGTDLDPLSVLISKAKTTLLNSPELRVLNDRFRHLDYSASFPELVPNVKTLGHWFTPLATQQLSTIKQACLDLREPLRTFALVVFSSIIRRVSNADDQTQKTYVSHTLPKSPPLPSDLFPVFLGRAIQGMREFQKYLPRPPNGFVIRMDARNLSADFDFDDIVTSPPYIDSVEYVYNQMLEYYWLGPELGLARPKEWRGLQAEFMGFRENDTAVDPSTLIAKFFPRLADEFSRACAVIGEVSALERARVLSFFLDYSRHVQKAREAQDPGDFYSTIVGNSRIRGVTIPTVELVASVHESLGYELVGRYTYAIRRHYMKFPRRSNSGKIGEDNILIFQAA